MNKDTYRIFPAPAEIDLGYLIEDWQNLARAYHDHDWDSVRVTMDCLAELIQTSEQKNPDLKFQPCCASLVDMGQQAGVVARPDGTDFLCANGCPVHEIMYGETEQCGHDCKVNHDCEPELGWFRMAGGHVYNGNARDSESVIRSLEH